MIRALNVAPAGYYSKIRDDIMYPEADRMTAVSLFDLLAREGSSSSDDSPQASLAELAQTLVSDMLADWKRLKEYEQRYSPSLQEDPQLALEITRSIYLMFQEWAREAEQVLARVQKLAASGQQRADIAALEDAHAFAMARLKLTPEKLAQAMQQARSGNTVPAEELRNELRARLRA
jgi:hypothetical protein